MQINHINRGWTQINADKTARSAEDGGVGRMPNLGSAFRVLCSTLIPSAAFGLSSPGR
jgi:hypothetical protein